MENKMFWNIAKINHERIIVTQEQIMKHFLTISEQFKKRSLFNKVTKIRK